MKNIDRIIGLYRDDPRTKTILNAFDAPTPARIQIKGTAGAQDAFVLTGTYLAAPRTQLWIANDKEEAAYLQNNVSNLLDGKTVRFFPDSFKRPMYFEELRNDNVLERTETINKITSKISGSPELIISYPEALFEKVVSPKALDENRILMVKGEEVDIDFMIEMLIEYGFKREDFVYEPGQFSIRGSIIDIFSYGNEYPYRIELFDVEVESIRTFDPLTQLSIQKIAKVSIVPNINTKFDRSQKVSLLQVLPENTTIWVKDTQMLLEKLQQCFDKAEEFAQNMPLMDESELGEIFRDRAFIKPDEVATDLQSFNLVSLTPNTNSSAEKLISYQSKSQPAFNKNFSLLIDNLSSNSKAGIENFIFTENPKQIERFYNIFEDLEANVQFQPAMKAIHQGFIDLDHKIACYTDHQIFQRHHHYRLKQGFTKDKAVNLKMLRDLQPGDFVVHIDHGVGRYSGLEKITVGGHTQESVRIFYKNNDVLYVSINSLNKLSKYSGKDGAVPSLSKLGSDAWQNLKRKTKRKVKDIAKELIKLYAKRKASKGHAFPPDNYLQVELEASFIYEDTPDQEKATIDMKNDMMKPHPMDRLICGDVGFGKTEIAIRGAFKAISDGKQVAILVPTTILALQHYKTFSERLKDFNPSIDYINRFKTAKQKKEIFQKLKDGQIDIVIGTHGLLNKDVGFKDLGLLVIDEEQKFGVAAKEKLRNLKVNVDTLTLTATPIPRTLQFSLMAARDLSVIRTPPPNRQPIHTEVRVFNEGLIKDSIYQEVHRGGQVFFVHNRVKTLPDMAAIIQRLCPDVDIAMAHGQLESNKLEKVLLDFIERKYDVLICTNIIETGLDIPNANTMIINNANQFGLSDLHQLRGRIGRSNKKAYCYLFAPPISVQTPDARKRLKTIEEYSDLGSGFNIAMRDLDIRGAGNLLGGEQSGFIADIGYETFQRILEEAIEELKESEFKEVFSEEREKKKTFVREVIIDTDVEMHLPNEYVSSVNERLSLYTSMNKLTSEEELESFIKGLEDRFGKIPKAVNELFDGLRIQWIAKELGFERILLKSNKLRCFFVENPQSPYYESEGFQRVFQYIASKGKAKGLTFKQKARHLIVIKEHVKTLKVAREVLINIQKEVFG